MRTRIALAAISALFITLASACGSSSSPATPTQPTPSPTPTASGTPVSVVPGASGLTTNAYSPGNVTVAVGGTVSWTNNDITSHTVTSNSNVWDSGLIGAGRTFSRTFPTAGSFPYHCTIHPGMSGTVTVQ